MPDNSISGDNFKTAAEILTSPHVVRPAPLKEDGTPDANPAVIPNPNHDRFRGGFLTIQFASDIAELTGENQVIYKSTEMVGLPNQYY